MKLDNNQICYVVLEAYKNNDKQPDLITSFSLTIDLHPLNNEGHKEVYELFNKLIELHHNTSSKPIPKQHNP